MKGQVEGEAPVLVARSDCVSCEPPKPQQPHLVNVSECRGEVHGVAGFGLWPATPPKTKRMTPAGGNGRGEGQERSSSGSPGEV